MMKRVFALIACAAGLYGCASSGPVPHLSDHKLQKLDTDADRMAVEGGPLPPSMAKLNPVQVYADHGNIVIALHRDTQGEQGFYIVPTVSSYDPRFGPRPDWNFIPVYPADPYLNNMFQYERRWGR